MTAPSDDLESLRRRADDLEVGQEALEAYGEIFELDPDDRAAANMVGRSLEHLGHRELARDHWTLVTELQPDNAIAAQRLRNLRHLPRTTVSHRSSVFGPRRPPEEIVEPVLAGPGRAACLQVLARSIQLTEQIDRQRLAVTDRPSDGRFRVSGGKGSGVTPWRGLLCLFVHRPSLPAATLQAVLRVGGRMVVPAGELRSLPDSVEYGIPFAAVDQVAAALEKSHREHLVRSIQAGPAPWGHRHDQALRDYIVEAAHAA